MFGNRVRILKLSRPLYCYCVLLFFLALFFSATNLCCNWNSISIEIILISMRLAPHKKTCCKRPVNPAPKRMMLWNLHEKRYTALCEFEILLHFNTMCSIITRLNTFLHYSDSRNRQPEAFGTDITHVNPKFKSTGHCVITADVSKIFG